MSGFSDKLVQELMAAADATARELGVPSSIAVVDNGGNLRAFMRQDGTRLATIEASQRKAYTSAASGLATHQWEERGRGDTAVLTILGTGLSNMLMLGGGVPITVDGALVGGIGVSGGSPDQDRQVAEAGVAALQKA